MTFSAPHFSSRTAFLFIAAATLVIAPPAAFAQHGGGHGGGGHMGGGSHFSSGGHPAAAMAAPASHNSAHTTTTGPGVTSHPPATVNGARLGAAGNISALSSSGLPAGLALFAEPGTVTANRHVSIGFVPATGAWQLPPQRGTAVMTFSGQGSELWREPSATVATTGPVGIFSLSPSPFSHRGFRRPFLPFVGPGFGFFPGFGLFGFDDGFGCDRFWGWNNFGWGCGFGSWGPGYDMFYGVPNGAQYEQNDTSRIYGQYAPQNSPESENAVSTPPVLIYLTDGTGYEVTDYWVADNRLHYVTNYGAENSVEVTQFDLQRTVDENAERGVAFTLKNLPAAPPPLDPPPDAAPFAPEQRAPLLHQP